MLPETSVSFRTEDGVFQQVYDAAEEKCRLNLRDFGGRRVLIEGGGYDKIWLETQPMGGEMYALRDPEAALNNCLLFMEYQRADGRLPGSIRYDGGRTEPEYNKYQGFFFAYPALNLFYLSGKDGEYLAALKETLIRFDGCLRRTHHLTGDGLLSSFCVYDTGEDLALRYGDAPCRWEADTPPEGYRTVPMASMDVTSWSISCRKALAEICRIQGDPEAGDWARKADEAAAALRRGLWDEARGALFDRDNRGKTIDILCHNTLRCMYWQSISGKMADRFVREHLLNPAEFRTPFPLPSVAVNDPAFRNAPENNWSGQPEGLTWQRAIRALENYGYERLVTELGRILIRTIHENGCVFTQQYDPFTGKASRESARDGYGPTMLACLEYIAHIYGIHPHLGSVWFSLGSGKPYEYRTAFYGHRYEILSTGRKAEIRIDGRPAGRYGCGVRVITDAAGEILRTVPIEGGKEPE